MPTGNEMFSAITVMKVLTLVLTNSLGNYKSSYLNTMDNEGRCFVRKFVSSFQINIKNHKRGSSCICNCIGCAYIIVVILVGFRKIWQSSKKKLIKETPPLLQATKRMMFKNIRMSGFFQKRFLTLLVSNQRENIHRYKKKPENKTLGL